MCLIAENNVRWTGAFSYLAEETKIFTVGSTEYSRPN